MAARTKRHTRRFQPVPRQRHWQLVLALVPILAVGLALAAVASYHAAAGVLRQQTMQQLHALRVNAAREIERHFSRLESHVVGVAHDPSTLLALKQLGDATTELENDPRTEPARLRPQMERLKKFLEGYFRDELNEKSLDLRSLLLPQRSAVWLQAEYLARGVDPQAQAAIPEGGDASSYGRSHAMWDPVFRNMMDRFGFEDVYLVDSSSGRVVYSARKRPDFQTSLIDGPYAASPVGGLFRELRQSANAPRYRITDFAPYLPAHGAPAAFAGVPILDNGRVVGALVVQLSSETLTHLLSADGQWSQIGLGASGEIYLIGRGDRDSRMRSASRFGPVATTVARDGTTVLRQRVESQATSVTSREAEHEGEYISYRGVPVLGSAGWLPHLDGLNWTLIAEIGSAEALYPLRQLLTRTAWIAGLSFAGILAMLIGFVAAVDGWRRGSVGTEAGDSAVRTDDYQRRLEADLRPVVAAAAAALRGDLSQQLTANGSVLGDLPHTLNHLWRSTSALVGHVQSTSTSAIDSATQIQTAAHQLSKDAERHTTALNDATLLLREIRSHLDALAADTSVASHAEQSTAASARQSAESVAHVVAGIEELQQHTRTLTMKMKRLGERSMEISTITGTIQDITAQANMLALNATIEAARAGEHGLGFKTVANDVRKLAARTEAAAKDMADLVATLHSEAADAVDCIEQHSEEIERHTALVTDASHALVRCRTAFEQDAGRLAAIAAGSGGRTQAAEKMDEIMLAIAAFVRRVHVLSEQSVHNSAALLSMLSALNSWAHTFRVHPSNGASGASSAGADLIEFPPREAVEDERSVGLRLGVSTDA